MELVAMGLGAAVALFASLDVWYGLRMALTMVYARWLLPTVWDILEEQSFQGLVLLSDLDWLLHMNNARYLREADVARCVHMMRCGLFRAVRALGGHTVLAASCCRYRRSLRFLERFVVRTRLLGWDERAFFLEQRFVSVRDGFVCAVVLVRQHVVGASPDKAVSYLCQRKVESPELPEEVKHWLKYNEASSQRLRAESNMQKNSKDQ
ncbi:protein THEM6 isoform X2 [Eublepharis macularius]|uniref:Protein THEM6 n=1 Tax=Eublepharis macularius TaxID=481883 RepID=A0AA97JLH3_EUBMA|nr:protein THEM6 isoform X2 [Eublepharis macularius]